MAKNEEKTTKKEVKESKVKKHFFKDFKAELKKVIWPTPKQLVNNTTAVIVIVLIVSAIVFVLDTVFRIGNEYGITNLQQIVQEKFLDKQDEKVEDNSEEATDSENANETEANEQNAEGQEIQIEETNTAEENSNAAE